MFKTAAVSLILIVAVLAVAASSLLLATGSANGEGVAQTGTAIDYPPNPTPVVPCAPTEAACAVYLDAVVERQWQFAATEVLRSLNKAQGFTANDRKQLTEHEKNRSARQKYLLRLAALNQLAQR
jgi:hypothetical protein